MEEEIKNQVSNLKLQIFFSLNRYLDNHLDVYNVYIVKDPSKFLTQDYILDKILSELILAWKAYKLHVPWEGYIKLYQGTTRHVKTAKDHELHKMISKLTISWFGDPNRVRDDSLTANIIKLINNIQNKSETK